VTNSGAQDQHGPCGRFGDAGETFALREALKAWRDHAPEALGLPSANMNVAGPVPCSMMPSPEPP
jgi:hypothetical protein